MLPGYYRKLIECNTAKVGTRKARLPGAHKVYRKIIATLVLGFLDVSLRLNFFNYLGACKPK